MTPIDAADQIRQFARQYKAMQDVADTLQRVGSLEQAVVECERAVEVARTSRDAVLATIAGELAKAQAAVDAAKTTALNTAKAATADAERTKAQAKASADKIEAAAQAKADGLVAQANKSMNAVMNTEWAALARQEKAITQAIEAETRAATAAAAADKAEAMLAKAREQIAKLLA